MAKQSSIMTKSVLLACALTVAGGALSPSISQAGPGKCRTFFGLPKRADGTIQPGDTFVRPASAKKAELRTKNTNPGMEWLNEPTKSVYLGRFGGQHLALENEWVYILDDETVKAVNLNPGANDLPAISAQTLRTNCLPTAIAYLQSAVLKEPAIAQRARAWGMEALDVSIFDPFGLFRSNAQVQNAQAEYQSNATEAALKASGFKYEIVEESDNNKKESKKAHKKILEALHQGKRALIAVTAIKNSLTVVDEAGDIKSYTTLTPFDSDRGVSTSGHAMAALGAFEYNDDYWVILADPLSGKIIPYKTNNGRIPGLQGAFILDNP